jgi:hypothetical protein
MAETPTYQMTEARPANYWMSSYAIYIQLNAAGDYNYIHANCSSGSVIMCHVDGINELSYDSGHNYRRWQLTASPTVFHDNVARYVYIAIPKSAAADAMAVVVFPSEKIDIYGKNAKGEQIGSTDYYYIFTQGIISDSYSDGGSHARTWTQEIDTGTLASDEALASGGEGKWWDYNSSADTVKFLKAISEAIINKLTSAWASIKQLVLNGHLINGVSSSSTPVTSDDTLVTPKYGEEKWLSKTHDDTADGQLTFGKGFISKEWGIFNEGWKTGSYDGNTVYDHGAMVDKDGHGVFQSLFARGFISAPKFVFNEINVTMAEQWNTNAFGTIESVDTKTRQITLHLEENDYGSVSVGDICRGIFADLGDTYHSDSNVEGALDDCNFVVHRGFFTTYFTVEKIITNEKGHCVFQYRKRTKTTPDPCAYMDFAQYGSFTDKTRQSSMYLSSRGHSFIEVLDGVDNWEIQPQNRVARYGWLGDLVIQHDDGTKETLKGNGLFAQNHVYFGGDIIKLSNISDLDDLQKMAGAYDVSLSRYQGVVTVDDMGNVIGGIYTLSDMPQADGSVKQVKQWRLSTAVFVRKGQDILLEEDEGNEQVTEGHYRVTAFGDGCECEIANSTVYITSIKNLRDGEADTEEEINYNEMRKMERCRVSIVVELEGKTSKTIEFPIRIAHDALPFLDCDLDNEHASVSWNTKAKKYTGFPVKSVATLLYHNNPWQIDKDSHVDGLPDGLKADISFAGKKMVISITTDGKKTGDFLAKKEGDTTVTTHNLSIHIIGTYAGARYEYSKLLTIDRRADTTVYEMIPSADSIIMDKDKTLSVNTLSCEVWATSSDDKRYKVDDLSAAGLEIKYCKGDGTPGLAFGSSVSVTKDDKSVVLGLFNKTTGELLDRETVPVVAWGEDGKGVEFIYFRSKDAQTVLDNFKPDEWFADPNYQGGSGAEYVGEIQNLGWTDDPQGVDSAHPYEYVSVRKSVNGIWGKFSHPAIYATMARSIKGVNTFYAIVAQDQAGTKPSDSEFTHDDLSDVVISDNKGKWIWSADKVEYFDGSAPDYLNKTCLGACEELANVTEQYGVSTDPSVQPSAPYYPNGAYPTNLKDGDCIWSRDHIVWLNNSSSNTDWQFIGKIGVDGDGVTSTEIAYGSSTSDQNLPDSWYDSPSKVTINDTYCWFWTRTIWHYKKSADKTAYTKSYKGKNGVPATYYEARFSEQRAAVYVEQGYETGYVAVKFSGSFYLVEGDNASLASGSGLGLTLEFLNEAGTPIASRNISANGSSFSYSSRDIQSEYRNKGADKITSCRYTVICNDGRDTKSGVIPIGFNAGSVFYHTDERFESLLQNDKGYSELTQTVDGICTHVQRLETNMLMGTTTGLGWTIEKTATPSNFSFSEVNRQFTIQNYYPAFRSGFSGKATAILKSPIIRVEPGKKYIASFEVIGVSNVQFDVNIRYGTTTKNVGSNSDTDDYPYSSRVSHDNKAENVIVQSSKNGSRYFIVFTAKSGYNYLQILFVNAVEEYSTSSSTTESSLTYVTSAWPYSSQSDQHIGTDTVTVSDDGTVKTTVAQYARYTGSSDKYGTFTKTTVVKVLQQSLWITKPQLEEASRDKITDIEPSDYKEAQNVVESYIQQTADSIEMHASKIIFKGETVINEKFIVDDYGNVTLNDLTANNATINGTFTAGEGNGKIVITSNKNYGQLSLSNYVWLGYSGVSSITGSDTINMKSSYGGLLAIMSKANIDYYGTHSDGIYLTSITGMGIDTEYANIRRAHIDRSVFGVAGGSSLYGEVQKSLDDNLTTYLFMSNPSEITLPMPANPENGNTLIVVQLGAKINFKSDFGFQHGTDTASVVNSNGKGTWTCFVFFNQKWHTSWFDGRPW